jgi:hypothetical protein
MKADQSKHDAGAKLKNGEFKEFFKDGTLASVGKYATAKKSASGSITCETEYCRPWVNSLTTK